MTATNDPFVSRYSLPGVPLPILEDDVANKAYVDSGSVSAITSIAEFVNKDITTNINLQDITDIPLVGTQKFLDSDFEMVDEFAIRVLFAGRVKIRASVYQFSGGQRASIVLRVRKNGVSEGPFGVVSYIRNQNSQQHSTSTVEWITDCVVNDSFSVAGVREGDVTSVILMTFETSMILLERKL